MASLGLVNWDGPRRFAGQRSYALVREGAILELAVTRLAVDLRSSRGLSIVIPPVMVKERAMTGTGFFPLGREEAYSISADELFLVGTSEVALVSLHADETLEEGSLPIRYAGLSPCFRREAGAHGKDTRGLYRVHQFTKVEQVVFCSPTRRWPRRSTTRCSGTRRRSSRARDPVPRGDRLHGEIGLGQTRKHEVESWMPGRNAYARPTRARRSATSRPAGRTSACAARTARSATRTR